MALHGAALMKSGNRLVSIVIPCFNAEPFVREAIDSALRQTYDNREVIVIDDGSTDGSLGVIQSFGDRVAWHTGANRGACAARNLGLHIASGEFIKFLDADDVLVSNAVDTQVDQSKALKSARHVVYGATGSMDQDGNDRRVEKRNGYDQKHDLIAYLIENYIQTSASLYRRQVLLELGGFNERLPRGQEYELHVRYALAGAVFHYRPTVVAYLRDHASPYRIRNLDSIAGDPFFFLKQCSHIRDLITRSTERPLTQPVREALAREIWHYGRAVCRAGHPRAAEKYFEAARSLSPVRHMVGTNLYRLTTRLFGPRIAEGISLWRERARTPQQYEQDKEIAN